MTQEIVVERLKEVDISDSPKDDPAIGEHVYIVDKGDRIEIHQDGSKIAEVPAEKMEEVRDLEPQEATISGFVGTDHLKIELLD